jgi:hypothetical protein
VAIGAVAAAEQAAQQGDSLGALRRLRAAGSWALDIAQKVGLTVAERAIKIAMGLD